MQIMKILLYKPHFPWGVQRVTGRERGVRDFLTSLQFSHQFLKIMHDYGEYR
jgi:RNase adaptor protein for sRNA GlmZ degradation